MKNVIISDTTLRDGLQAPGIYLSFKQRLEIAKLLKQAGIREIEAGIPAAGKEEMKHLEKLIETLHDDTFRIITWNRGKKEDIRKSISCNAKAINISFPVSDIMIGKKLRKDKKWVMTQLASCLEFAKEKDLYVSIGCEDATRSDILFLINFIKLAKKLGADRVRIADTTGCMTPSKIKNLIKRIKDNIEIPIEIHTHNDFGLATANALAGVEAEVNFVSTSVNGIGERAGNASIEEIATSLEILYKIKTGINLKLLPTVSSTLSIFSGIKIPQNKPIIGENVFTSKSGIHIDGILKEQKNYISLKPELFGRNLKFYIGYYSGVKTVKKLVKKIGLNLTDKEIRKLHLLLFETGKSFTIDELKNLILKENFGRDTRNEKGRKTNTYNKPNIQRSKNDKRLCKHR